MVKLCCRVLFILLLPGAISLAKDYKGAEYRTKEAYTYGRFEARYKPPKGDGFLASFFTYHEFTSSKEWNEIDFEILGRYDHDVQVTSIGPGQKIRNSHQWVEFNTHDDFHNYAFEWTPDYIAWFVDDKEIYRQAQEHIAEFKYDQKIMMNIWPPEWEPWAGKLDERVLPVFAYYDWVSYASYTPGSGNTGADNNFTLLWKDDFDTWDQNRWEKASHTFGGNKCDFMPENAVIKDGCLILCLTKTSTLGFVDLTPPAIQWARAYQDKITIGFTEKLEPSSAQKKSNYLISGITIAEATLAEDNRTVVLTVSGLNPANSYNLVILGIKDDSPAHNMMTGQVINLMMVKPLSFPVKINVGGKAYKDYLPDQIWRPELEYGHQDGYEENWLGSYEIQGTEEDSVYLTGLHEVVTYRVRVPNGFYKVTLMMAENEFNEAGKRSFDIIVEGNRIEKELDLYQKVGAHTAHQVIADNVEIKDQMIDMHFTNRWNFSLLNGLVIEQISSSIKNRTHMNPDQFYLSQNYPNPFNSTAIIEYAVPKPCLVQIDLYNTLGQKIKTLVNGPKAIGIHTVQLQADHLTSGIYFYQILAGEFFQMKKLVLMK
jgi:beta-glucanase (GH16 family)